MTKAESPTVAGVGAGGVGANRVLVATPWSESGSLVHFRRLSPFRGEPIDRLERLGAMGAHTCRRYRCPCESASFLGTRRDGEGGRGWKIGDGDITICGYREIPGTIAERVNLSSRVSAREQVQG